MKKEKSIKKELKEQNEFLKDMIESLKELKKGKIQNFKFSHKTG